MYNEREKLAFLDDYAQKASMQKLVTFIFNAISSYEEKNGIDFAQFNDEETHEAVNAITGLRANSTAPIMYILKDYVRWCKKNSIPTSESIFTAKIDIVEKFRSQMIGNPRHLLMSLDDVFPHPERNEIEYVYRSFLWLAFSGFEDYEAIAVKQDDVRLDEMAIYFSGNIQPYAIYPESLNDLRMSISLIGLREPRGKNGVIKERAPGREILRGKAPGRDMNLYLVNTLRPMVSRAFSNAKSKYGEGKLEKPDSLSIDISYKHIYMSGMFYRAYEYERIGIPVDFVDVVERETSSISEDDERFGRNYSLNKRRNAMVRGYMDDYKMWKVAFSAQ